MMLAAEDGHGKVVGHLIEAKADMSLTLPVMVSVVVVMVVVVVRGSAW